MKLVVLGAGESGLGTAILGIKEGFEVFVSDYGKINNKYKQVLLHHEINWEEETHTEAVILSADIVMKSPGIPDNAPIVLKLNRPTTLNASYLFASDNKYGIPMMRRDIFTSLPKFLVPYRTRVTDEERIEKTAVHYIYPDPDRLLPDLRADLQPAWLSDCNPAVYRSGAVHRRRKKPDVHRHDRDPVHGHQLHRLRAASH